MFRLKRKNLLFKCKQIYFLFIFLFFSISSTYSQVNMFDEELALVGQEYELQDSIEEAQRVQEAVNFQYISKGQQERNYLLDNIKAIIIVNDNDFVSWIARMNKLHVQQDSFAPQHVDLKVHRPVWVLLVVLGLFIGVGLVRFFYYVNFQNIIYGFYNNRMFSQLNKDDSLLTSWPYIFLYCIFSIAIGLLFLIFKNNVLQQEAVDFIAFLKLVLAISVVFILKIVLVRLLGLIFEIERTVREYIVFLYLFYFNSILIIIPILLVLVFIPVEYLSFMFIFLLILVFILLLYRVFSFFMSAMGGGRFSMFYLILYICTLEIAPILILVKTLSK